MKGRIEIWIRNKEKTTTKNDPFPGTNQGHSRDKNWQNIFYKTRLSGIYKYVRRFTKQEACSDHASRKQEKKISF